MSINPQNFYKEFLKSLENNPSVDELWRSGRWGTQRWTQEITGCIVSTIKSILPDISQGIAAKRHRDSDGRQEYFAIDVTAYEPSYRAPIIAVEHENSDYSILYSVWKLLCVYADLRVAICYIDPSEEHRGYRKSVEELFTDLRQVTKHHPDKKVALIVGRWEELSDWSKIYSLHLLPEGV